VGDPVAGTVPHLRNPAEARRHGHARGGLNTMSSLSNPSDARAEVRARNLRLGLILASTALVFFVGFVVKVVVLSHP
jgi:hypothetical protein